MSTRNLLELKKRRKRKLEHSEESRWTKKSAREEGRFHGGRKKEGKIWKWLTIVKGSRRRPSVHQQEARDNKDCRHPRHKIETRFPPPFNKHQHSRLQIGQLVVTITTRVRSASATNRHTNRVPPLLPRTLKVVLPLAKWSTETSPPLRARTPARI